MPRKRSVEISVEPNEVVLRERRLEVRAPAALKPETASAVIRLASAPATVSLSNGKRTATVVPEGELPAGPHTLLVGELVSGRGERLSDPVEVPFFVSDSRAKVASAHRVESIVRLQVDRLGTTRVSAAKRPEGRYIEIMKTVNRRTGKAIELAFDQRGAAIDANAVFEKIRRSRQAEFGKLHPVLKRAVEERGRDERIPVAVWLRLPDEELPEKREKGATARPPRTEAEHAKRITETAERIGEVLRGHGAVNPRPDPHAPVVFAEVPADRIRRLEKHDAVAALFLYDRDGEVDLSNSMKIAQSDTVQSSPPSPAAA